MDSAGAKTGDRSRSAQEICRQATKLFARRGFDGTSLQAIAEAVGIAKPSLLYHYPSKDALREAVLENVFQHWKRTVPQLLEAVASGQARFDALMHELIVFFRKDTDRALLLTREMMDRPAEMRVYILDNLRPWLLVIGEYIRQGQHTGQLREDVDPESYLLHVVTLTVASLGNLPLIAGALAPDEALPAVTERHLAELRRMAHAALFRSRA